MEHASASGVPGDMGALGEAVCDDLFVRRLGQWSVERGMDSPTAWHPAGMPIGPLTIHFSSGRFGNLYRASVRARGPH